MPEGKGETSQAIRSATHRQLFERYAKGGKDPKLKDWAGRTLHALRRHLEMAEALDNRRK
jgi:putative membrane protein